MRSTSYVRFFAVVLTVGLTKLPVASATIAGEFTYGIALKGTPVGLFVQKIASTTDLGIRVEETLVLNTISNSIHQRSKTYLFESIKPHGLQYARALTKNADNLPTRAEFTQHPESNQQRLQLADLLIGLDSKLVNQSQYTYRAFNHYLDEIHAITWRVIPVSAEVVTLHDPTLIVDPSGLIKQIYIAGLEYSLLNSKVEEENWLNSMQPPFESLIEVPVNRSIENPRNTRTLKLRFISDQIKSNSWYPYLMPDGSLSIDRGSRTKVSALALRNLPLLQDGDQHVLLSALANQLELSSSGPMSKAKRLLKFVNTYLEYVDLGGAPTLAEVIKSRRGDCTEFAELFRALGDHIGLSVRTVYGLVYEPSANAFRSHAWNEVAINDYWISFDPTFDQVGVDATHIPYPNQYHALLLYDLRQVRFEIIEASYTG